MDTYHADRFFELPHELALTAVDIYKQFAR